VRPTDVRDDQLLAYLSSQYDGAPWSLLELDREVRVIIIKLHRYLCIRHTVLNTSH